MGSKYIVVMRFFGGVKFAKIYNGLKNFWDSIKENGDSRIKTSRINFCSNGTEH